MRWGACARGDRNELGTHAKPSLQLPEFSEQTLAGVGRTTWHVVAHALNTQDWACTEHARSDRQTRTRIYQQATRLTSTQCAIAEAERPREREKRARANGCGDDNDNDRWGKKTGTDGTACEGTQSPGLMVVRRSSSIS